MIKNIKLTRGLLISGSVILLCMTVIVGMTFALFTDSKSVRNHLRAGALSITLTRTHLEYAVLDEQGKLAVTVVEEPCDFSGESKENVFGVDAEGIRIVPGSYFKAQMEIENGGDAAFTYNVGIQLIGEPNSLMEQLLVTVTHPDGSKTEKMLNELVAGLTVSVGEMEKGAAAQTFTVEISFVDDTAINNAAQMQLAEFDLLVTATQKTE